MPQFRRSYWPVTDEVATGPHTKSRMRFVDFARAAAAELDGSVDIWRQPETLCPRGIVDPKLMAYMHGVSLGQWIR